MPGRSALPPVAFRIGGPLWQMDGRFQALLDFFGCHPGMVDGLAFFTSATHPPLPLDEIERETERLCNFLSRVREGGMRAGINILSTMGYHAENLPRSLNDHWQRVMDTSRKTSLGSFCPPHPDLLDYGRKICTARLIFYTMSAEVVHSRLVAILKTA